CRSIASERSEAVRAGSRISPNQSVASPNHASWSIAVVTFAAMRRHSSALARYSSVLVMGSASVPRPNEEYGRWFPAGCENVRRTCAERSAERRQSEQMLDCDRRSAAGTLVAAEDGGLRRFPGPDLSETHGLQRRRLRIRPDELVFENA